MSRPDRSLGHDSQNQESKDCLSKTILIIDDDEAIRFLFKFAIERNGYKVFIAANGKEGIDLLASMPEPCLILLDLMMPIMDGWSFLDEIESSSQWRNIPIVVLTAFPVNSSSIRANEVFNKPVELSDLLQAVQNWC